jgi:hypothetical protein
MFNAWGETDMKSVYTRLRVGALLASVPFIACCAILTMGRYTNYIAGIPIFWAMGIPVVFLSINPYGVKFNFTMVYPIFPEYTFIMIAIEIISASIYLTIISYAGFAIWLKDIQGYKSYGEVKKAINSLIIHGLVRDKTLFALDKAGAIITAIGLAIGSLGIPELIPISQAALAIFSAGGFGIILYLISGIYIRRRIVQKDRK